jgi:hypothetical protein
LDKNLKKYLGCAKCTNVFNEFYSPFVPDIYKIPYKLDQKHKNDQFNLIYFSNLLMATVALVAMSVRPFPLLHPLSLRPQ